MDIVAVVMTFIYYHVAGCCKTIRNNFLTSICTLFVCFPQLEHIHDDDTREPDSDRVPGRRQV